MYTEANKFYSKVTKKFPEKSREEIYTVMNEIYDYIARFGIKKAEEKFDLELPENVNDIIYSILNSW